MKSKKKVFVTVLCAVLLVVASVLGTMAYLTSQDTATNTFTVGDVEITLDEALVGADGKALTGDDAERVKGNSYHIIPGGVYDKDPTVTVKADSEDCYVRALVTLTNYDAIYDLPSTIKISNVFDLNRNWEFINETVSEDGKTCTYELRYNSKVLKAADDTKLPAIFTKVTIPGSLTNDQLSGLDRLKIDVVAQAIQADGFADADAAWDAF